MSMPTICDADGGMVCYREGIKQRLIKEERRWRHAAESGVVYWDQPLQIGWIWASEDQILRSILKRSQARSHVASLAAAFRIIWRFRHPDTESQKSRLEGTNAGGALRHHSESIWSWSRDLLSKQQPQTFFVPLTRFIQGNFSLDQGSKNHQWTVVALLSFL